MTRRHNISFALLLRIAIAIVMIGIVLYFLISPVYDLPETDLRVVVFALLLLCVVAALFKPIFLSTGVLLFTVHPSVRDCLPDRRSCSPLSLRC